MTERSNSHRAISRLQEKVPIRRQPPGNFVLTRLNYGEIINPTEAWKRLGTKADNLLISN